MNNKIKSISLGLSLLLGASFTISINNNKKDYKDVSAYETSSLPTTIDLNDTSESDIRSYYKNLNSLDASERQGTNLLKNLKTILKNGQNFFNYDSGSTVWQLYEIADRDWEKSPASSTTYGTYDSENNIIRNYTYGTNESNSKNNPYIHALYINRNVTNLTTAWDNHGQDEWGINREHVWPKAEGFDTKGAGGARGDPMHLMAGNGYSNNIHSNYFYGFVNTSLSYTNCGTKYSNQNGNLRGISKTLNSGTVFEPQDSDKGDIARAIFYMVARYNYLSGEDSDGINSNNPNLELVNNVTDFSSTGYTCSTSRTGKMGILTDLLAWHHLDPVDEYERHRNNLLYTNYTNNRNPFIDFPEWADFIWGTVNYDGSTYKSYNSTPTGVATPSSDTINGYNESGEIVEPTVNSVMISPTSLSINVGTTGNLSATVNVSNDAPQTVSWTSSNTSVATVNGNGVVTGVSAGSATIRATSTFDNNKSATCSVTVTASGGGNTKTDVLFAKGFAGYTEKAYGEAGTDYEAVANSTNETDVTYALQVFYGSTGAVRGNQATASGNFSARNTITKAGYYISSISLTVATGTIDGSTEGRSVVYFGDSAYGEPSKNTPTGDYVSASPNESEQSTLTWTNSNKNYNYFLLYNLKTASSAYCRDADNALTITWTQKEKALSSISVTGQKTSFMEGDEFEFNGTVTANYDDDSTLDVTESATFDGYNPLSIGQQSISVSFGGKSTTYNVEVSRGVLNRIILYGYQDEYEKGDSFSFDGGCIAEYTNGYNIDVTDDVVVSSPDMSTSGVKTVTVSYTYNGKTVSSTYDITVLQPAYTGHGTSPEDPLTVLEALEIANGAATATSEEYYTIGVISYVKSYSAKYQTITYKISDDGSQNNELTVFGCKGEGNENFSAMSNLTIGSKVMIVGNLFNYGGNTPEYTEGCYIYRFLEKTNTSVVKVISEQGYSNGQEVSSLDLYNKNSDTITASFDIGTNDSNAPKYYNNGYSLRLYSGNTMTIASSKAPITSIVLSFGSGEGSNEITTDVGTYSNGVWTGNANSITFTVGGSTGQRRISSITVMYFGAYDFAKYFLDNIGCDETGLTSPSGNWSTFASKYALLFTEDQNTLTNAEVNESGITIEQMAARYDYIVKKYGTSSYSNFISRDGLSSNSGISIIKNNESNSSFIVIIILSLSSISLTGLYLYIKHKKEE